MRKLILILSAVALYSLGTLRAQLGAPNEVGVTGAHMHLHVASIEANKQFWTALGGISLPKHGDMDVVKFPGLLVLMRQADAASGGTDPVVRHWGFSVSNLQESLKKWKMAGVNTESGHIAGQAFAISPDHLRIEIFEDVSQKIPIKMRNLSFFVPEDSVTKIQNWYVENLGAKPGSRSGHATAQIPGASLTFIASPTPTGPTKGRVLDHIGFDLKNLEAFCKMLEARGVKFDQAYSKRPGRTATAWLTDPAGTLIELSEELDEL